jgi:hypothetical protein
MQFKTCLLSAPGAPFCMEDLMPQRPLAAMAGALLHAGFPVSIADLATPEHAPSDNHANVVAAMNAAIAASPQLVVLHVARRKDLPNARAIAAHLHACLPGAHVLVSGAYAEAYGAVLIAAEPAFDAVLLLDPEVAIVEAATQLSSGIRLTGTPNMAVYREGVAHRGRRRLARSLDDLPLPCYDAEVYPAVHRGEKLRLFEIEQSRGGAGTQMGPTAPWSISPLRLKSPSECLREMEHIRETTPSAEAFHLSGQSTPAQAVEHLCFELRGLERPLRYSRDVQVLEFESISAHSLYASGCRVLRFALHSGSQRLLEDFYGQQFKVSEAERALHRAQRARLMRVADFTYPTPADDRHTHAETLRLLTRTMPEAIRVEAPELRPESTWRDWQAAYGFVVEDSAYRAWAMCDAAGKAPYRMMSWTSEEQEDATRRLLGEVSALGIHEGLTPREALMARILGLEEELPRFSLLQHEALQRQDTAEDLVRIFNEKASRPANMIWFPFQPQLRAANN